MAIAYTEKRSERATNLYYSALAIVASSARPHTQSREARIIDFEALFFFHPHYPALKKPLYACQPKSLRVPHQTQEDLQPTAIPSSPLTHPTTTKAHSFPRSILAFLIPSILIPTKHTPTMTKRKSASSAAAAAESYDSDGGFVEDAPRSKKAKGAKNGGGGEDGGGRSKKEDRKGEVGKKDGEEFWEVRAMACFERKGGGTGNGGGWGTGYGM